MYTESQLIQVAVGPGALPDQPQGQLASRQGIGSIILDTWDLLW